MAAGTPFSASHTLAQTGPFRPRNLVRGTANAVLAGCGTTPGVGIPPVLISGRLAAERITGPRPAERAGHGAAGTHGSLRRALLRRGRRVGAPRGVESCFPTMPDQHTRTR
nr:FAD-dependent oxidoreductase [Pseudonocardia sp. ICBG601]